MDSEKLNNPLFSIKLFFEPNKNLQQVSFPEICSFVRETFNVTQAQMAQRLESGFSSYQHWEYGTRKPSAEASSNLTLMYLQCLHIRNQTPKATEIKPLLEYFFGKEIFSKPKQVSFPEMCLFIRETFNATQAQMAQRLESGFSSYQQWEYGRRKPSAEASSNLTLMYLQCLHIRNQTPKATKIKLIFDSFLNQNSCTELKEQKPETVCAA